jgi:biphenyl-2,3-diol 1,2-dioxygenase
MREPEIAKIGHAALVTPDLEASHHFVHDLLGLDEVERRDGVVYYRAWGEFEHHSLSLREGPVGVDHLAWRTRRPEDVDAFAEQLRAAGTEVATVEAGEEAGQGPAIRFVSAGGHPFEIYFQVDKPQAPEEIRSRLPSQPATSHRRGGSPRRIDHYNLATAVANVGNARDFLAEQMGLKTREYLQPDDGPLVAAWMSVTSNVHDTAIVADLANPESDGRLHHIAYYFDNYEDVYRCADMLREEGITLDAGPGIHGIARAMFCYAKDPGSGHRFELYSGGYQIFDPDWEPVRWSVEDIVEGMVWTGERFLPGDGGRMDGTTPCLPQS